MKRKIIWSINIALFACFFNLIYFLSVDVHSATRWISYVAIMFAFFFNYIALFTSPKSEDSFVHSYPRLILTTSYFVLELFLGLLFIFINSQSYIIPLLTQGGLFVICATWFTFLLLSEDSSTLLDKKSRKDFEFYNAISIEMEIAMKNISGRSVYKIAEKAYDAIKGMQAVGCSESESVEKDIFECVEKLKKCSENGESIAALVEQIKKLVSQRNKIIRLKK